MNKCDLSKITIEELKREHKRFEFLARISMNREVELDYICYLIDIDRELKRRGEDK